MNELLAMFASPVWWFSTIVVGLVFMLLGPYTKPWTDRMLSLVSEAWRGRTERARREFQVGVERCLASPQALQGASEEELRRRLGALFLLVMVVMLLGLAGVVLAPTVPGPFPTASPRRMFGIVLVAAAFIANLMAMSAIEEAARQARLVRRARQILSRHELRQLNEG